jgi:hypothetical protein
VNYAPLVRKAFHARTSLLLVIREFIENAQRVFEALHGAERIVGVQIRRVEAVASDKEFRLRRCIIIGRSEPMPPKSAVPDPDPRSGSNPSLCCKAKLAVLPATTKPG